MAKKTKPAVDLTPVAPESAQPVGSAAATEPTLFGKTADGTPTATAFPTPVAVMEAPAADFTEIVTGTPVDQLITSIRYHLDHLQTIEHGRIAGIQQQVSQHQFVEAHNALSAMQVIDQEGKNRILRAITEAYNLVFPPLELSHSFQA